MRHRNDDVRLALLRGGGVLRIGDHRDLRHQVYRLATAGALTSPFPGVFCATEDLMTIDVRLRAAALWRPDGVVIGRGAARLTYWPDVVVPRVQIAVPGGFRTRPGVEQVRRIVPPEWQMRFTGITMTRPPLTALDLIPELDGSAISTALRRGVSMDDLHAALTATPGRRHNHRRAVLLHTHRGLPWSDAEQMAHELMRSARIKGWIANYEMRIDGQRRYLDLLFEEAKLCVEIDGYEFHGLNPETRERFEDDRFVTAELVRRGWRVLRFTWRQLTERPEWVVACIRDVLGSDGCGCRRRNVA